MSEGKPLIGILASHDSELCNDSLVKVLDFLVEKHQNVVDSFQFAITRGTYNRVLMSKGHKGVKDRTKDALLNSGVLRLPCRSHGGVVLLTDLVVKRKMKIVWPFLTPATPHWLSSENLALLRLCDHCHVNRLMNEHSVIEWALGPLSQRHRQAEPWPPRFRVGGVRDDDIEMAMHEPGDGSWAINWKNIKKQEVPGPTLALIAHNEMKSRIEEFTLDYQDELLQFHRIVTTGTTGKIVQDIAPKLAHKVRRYNSGPKGGDIEIAVEMIFKRCDVAVFLVDPLSAHPHSEDIKVLFGAAILNRVRLLTNERQARDWMDSTKGKVNPCQEYSDWLKTERDEKLL
jgi:methylglyoxal synthase